MSCATGTSDWVTISSPEACFVNVHNYYEACVCPISTCQQGLDGYYSCEFTSFTKFIFWFFAISLAALVLFYLWWQQTSDFTQKEESLSRVNWQKYNDTMFGVYHATADNDQGEKDAKK